MKYFVTFIGTHCSWKSSYARAMFPMWAEVNEIKTEEWYKVTVGNDVFALWHYHNQCGGWDWFGKLSKTKQGIIDLSTREEKFMVGEWILFISEPMFDVFRKMSQISWRKVIVVYLYVSIAQAMGRLMVRNWWKARKSWLATKKVYYDKRIKALEESYPDFNFLYVNTENTRAEEIIELIKSK